MTKLHYATVDGGWGTWSSWSTCSRSCKGGRTNRVRQCNDPLPMCGGTVCKGDNSQTAPCNKGVPCTSVANANQTLLKQLRPACIVLLLLFVCLMLSFHLIKSNTRFKKTLDFSVLLFQFLQ